MMHNLFPPLYLPSGTLGCRLTTSAASLAIIVLLSGCVNPINPLGRFDPTPKVASVPAPKPSEKFAWGISTASYQYENPGVKQGTPAYFSTDWDVLVSHKKAPPRGNALFSWTDFEKNF